jgi:hypothetical protein
MRHQQTAAKRAHAILRVKERLMVDSFPRMQMGLIVALTGGFGLLASFSLLNLGMHSMAARYPLALTFAYLFYLFLIWLWLRTNAEDYVDVPDLSGLSPQACTSECAAGFKSDGGGDFGGGGATGSFDGPAYTTEDAISTPLGGVRESVGAIAEADELAIPLAAIALALGIALASFYVVYIAPAIFAEVLVDGALSYALFRHLRGQDPRHWLSSTLRHTALPFVATAVFLAAVGGAMAAYVPEATSVGQVIEHARQP